MDRRRYPQQQYVPPGMVDFGQMDFGHDVVAQQMPGILQNYQQRWDIQDAAIAKLLEEQAGTQMLEGDAQAVGNLLKGSFDEIDTLVKEKYQGDRGAAAMDIVKRLSAARAPLAQAKAEKERYDKAFEQYQQSLHSGKVPHIIDPLTEQRRIQDFDEYHKLQNQQAFTDRGYIPRQYNALRGAADMENYLADNVSKALNAASYKGGLDQYNKNDVMGMLVHYSTSGATDKEIQDELSKGGGKQFVNQLRSGIPFLNEEYQEYEQEYGTEEANKHILDRAIDIVKGQVAEQYAEGYIRDLSYDPSPQNPNNPAIVHPYDTIVSPGNKKEKLSSIEKRFSTFRKNRQYILNAENIKGKRKALEPQINITNVSETLKPLGLTQFTANGLHSLFNIKDNMNTNAVQGVLQTYAEFYPEKAEKYLDRDSSGKFNFKTSINARGLVAKDFVELVQDPPFEKIDRYIKEQNEYISTNHGILKQALDEGKITEDELFDLAEQSEREKALTFDVGIIPKDKTAIEEINGMATYIGTNAEIVDKQSGESKSSKKSVSQEIKDREGIDRWTYNPLDGTVDYWTKDGGIVRTNINENGTKVVKEISGIISSTIDSYYKNDVNLVEIPLPVAYTNEEDKRERLQIKIIKEFDPVTKTIQRVMGMEEIQYDKEGNPYIGFRRMEPDQFINEMFAQIELFKGERIQQKPKDPNK